MVDVPERARAWLEGLPPEAAALPMASRLADCSNAFLASRSLVLEAEPGAGKTSLLPPWLSFSVPGRVLVLQPRRSAAAQAASRCAELFGERVGGVAGYQVRGEAALSARTRVLFLTEALLSRIIQDDPSLPGVSAVLIDEYHERSIHADLALALALEARSAFRPDLLVGLMSATLDARGAASFLSAHSEREAALLSVPGRAFPVEVAYLPPRERERLEETVARGVERALSETEGDILCFLPGVGEINRARGALAPVLRGADAEALALHGGLPLSEQLAVIRGRRRGEGRRRVILSTSIAQTSLTVPGVSAVVDAGLSRLSRYHVPSGMDRLVTERESAQDAVQRTGRAGRLGPGRAYRLWPETEALPASSEPEILRSDLSGLVLEAAAWGARRIGDLPFPDPPPRASWDRARELLEDLGLLEAGTAEACGSPTALGLRCAKLGLGPRLGALLSAHPLPLAAALAAFLQERDLSGLGSDADLRLRVSALRRGEGDQGWVERCRREAARIRAVAGIRSEAWSAEDEAAVGDILLSGFPDRLGRREPSGLYRFPSGRNAALFAPARGAAAGLLEGEAWIVATEIDSGDSVGLARAAAPVSEKAVERLAAERGKPAFSVDWQGLKPRPKACLLFGRLELGPAPAAPDREGIAAAVGSSFLDRLHAEGLSLLPFSEAASALLERARFFGSVLSPEGFPDLSSDGLIVSAAEWLLPFLDLSAGPGGSRPPVLDAGRAGDALSSLLSPWRRQIDREAPESFSLPSGRCRRLIYGEGEAPILEARVQDLFGLRVQPMACGRPLLIRLLSPAGRPVQTTADIAGFWAGSYAEVRKEMRGRYPKHFWPEDGASVSPPLPKGGPRS